jgi:hypothetical protein
MHSNKFLESELFLESAFDSILIQEIILIQEKFDFIFDSIKLWHYPIVVDIE